MNLQQQIDQMDLQELENYLGHLKMTAKMEDKFLLTIIDEDLKAEHRQQHKYAYQLQDYAHDRLKRLKWAG